MSAPDRLIWLAAEIHRGRSAFVSFSYNDQQGSEKVKFTLTDEYSNNGVYRPCVMAALSAIQSSFESSIVTDKGHRSKSTRQTVVEFWAKEVPQLPLRSKGKGKGKPSLRAAAPSFVPRAAVPAPVLSSSNPLGSFIAHSVPQAAVQGPSCAQTVPRAYASSSAVHLHTYVQPSFVEPDPALRPNTAISRSDGIGCTVQVHPEFPGNVAGKMGKVIGIEHFDDSVFPWYTVQFWDTRLPNRCYLAEDLIDRTDRDTAG